MLKWWDVTDGVAPTAVVGGAGRVVSCWCPSCSHSSEHADPKGMQSHHDSLQGADGSVFTDV